jgi:hypothetical protein
MELRDIVRDCAEGAWDVYDVYCSLIGEDTPNDFRDAPKHMRDSIKDLVKTILSGDFSGETIDGEELHSQWVVFLKDAGWKWGIALDVHAKQHPSLVSYELLPVDQRCKADLLAATIKGLLASIITTASFENVIVEEDEEDDDDSFDEDDEDDEDDES